MINDTEYLFITVIGYLYIFLGEISVQKCLFAHFKNDYVFIPELSELFIYCRYGCCIQYMIHKNFFSSSHHFFIYLMVSFEVQTFFTWMMSLFHF